MMVFCFNKYFIRHKMKTIQSKLHKSGNYDIYKRYVINEGIDT